MTLIEHVLKLTEHRDRELLQLTLAKALIDLLPLQKLVIAQILRQQGEARWLDLVRLDAKGGGRVTDPARVNFQTLNRLEDLRDRQQCLAHAQPLVIAWAGESGPRITYLPLLADVTRDDAGVIELHSSAPLDAASLLTLDQLRRVYRSMYDLLAYSERDPLTGLLNRKSLQDAFYTAILEDLDAIEGESARAAAPVIPGQERRHQVPANYWLGAVRIDGFDELRERIDKLQADKVLTQVARVMNNTFRTYDRNYHFVGDHFGVLMHCPTEELVGQAFERFRGNVEKFNFPQVGSLTVSCGFTRVVEDDTPDSALAKTGLAIGQVRAAGGNQVASYLALARQELVPS